ncbi:PREDICTED: probable arabinosyltransferase ARAD1 [Tarenaya hassleriana]|uniref:probable arabinosyltransferase ARAD1 n=1 Tax=Tarenaya hassleriana TaxID=28532 RepID=UPI00053C1445|nr:PREDICTED: probable arabinosyltransferase ARAD1 [Tarenaya hassleriana]
MVGKLLLCLFLVTSIIFVLSWSFVLHSTGQIHFLDYPLLHNPIFPAMNDVNSGVSTRGNDEHYNDEVKGEKDGNSVGQEIGKCMCEVPGEEPLKVYMYDMDPEFHFGLLDWKPEGNSSKSVWPDIRKHIPPYPGGLNLQHSIEYWLTLDLLASEFPDIPRANAAKRVHNSSEADVIFVPFFSSLSYNRFSNVSPHRKTSRNKELQEKLVKFLTVQDEWKRSGGRDHVVLAHHPNSMLDARNKLFPAMFILSDFGRYPPTVANLEKDVIAPYKHVIKSYENDMSDFDSRLILLYFQGAIYRKDGGFVRQELFYLLRDEKDVHFSFGSVKNDGVNKATQGMHNSKFCLNIAGDTPSSNRLFDAIASHCVPVIISDGIQHLKGDPGQGLIFRAASDLRLRGWCDADYAGCPLSRKSLSGWFIQLGPSPISWKTKKQSIPSLSSAESEYRAMRLATCELLWIKSLLSSFGVEHSTPMTLYCDSQAALHIAHNDVYHDRTKHIEVDCHFLRHHLDHGHISTSHVSTREQLADIFTKALGKKEFAWFIDKLGVQHLHLPT